MKRDEELARRYIMEILADQPGPIGVRLLGEVLIKFNFRLYYGKVWKHCEILRDEGRVRITQVYDSGVQDHEPYIEIINILERLAAIL